MRSRSPLVIGHRGAPGYRPEHSKSSYDLAFEFGVDAVEPDVVATKDRKLVIRHENEISTTTDVADRPEFADRKTTKIIDGTSYTGWFTEDFTLEELLSLTCRERLPAIRTTSATFNDRQPVMSFAELLDHVKKASLEHGRRIGIVLEVKHATYFESIGLDLVPLILEELHAAGWGDGAYPLWIESFEQTVLTRLQQAGILANYVYLLEDKGKPADLIAAHGSAAMTYAAQRAPGGLDVLAKKFDGISLNKRTILMPDKLGRSHGPSSVVQDAHERGLKVFTWTCRPENAFLLRSFRNGSKPEFGDFESEWGIIRDSGVDGVFVDHADLGVAFFRTP